MTLKEILAWLRARLSPPSKPPAPVPPAPVPPGPLPPAPGPLPPGGPTVMPVTTVADGAFAPRMMSDRANAWVTRDGRTAYVFAGSVASGGPAFFAVDLSTGAVTRVAGIPYRGETEGWSWTPDGKVMVPDGPRLRRVDPFTGHDEVVLDISETHPGHDLWQPHSSDDGQTHSATVRRIVEHGRYPYIGTVIQGPHGRRFEAAIGQLDESQVTRDGSHVVIKQNGEDNRIINLATGEVWDLSDADGAIGHSDCGHGCIIGEANLPGPGRCVWLDLHTRARITLSETDNMGYVSTRAGLCLLSGPTHLSLVALDGSGVTALLAHGGSTEYDDRVKANLSPCGRVACYMVERAVVLYVVRPLIKGTLVLHDELTPALTRATRGLTHATRGLTRATRGLARHGRASGQ